MSKSSQKVVQADGDTQLKVLGEIHTTFKTEEHFLNYDALVIKDLANDVIGGAPFLADNDIYVRMPKNGEQWNIHIGDKAVYLSTPSALIENIFKSYLLTTARPIRVLRGEFVKFPVPTNLSNEKEIFIEPMCGQDFFLPQSVPISDGQWSHIH